MATSDKAVAASRDSTHPSVGGAQAGPLYVPGAASISTVAAASAAFGPGCFARSARSAERPRYGNLVQWDQLHGVFSSCESLVFDCHSSHHTRSRTYVNKRRLRLLNPSLGRWVQSATSFSFSLASAVHQRPGREWSRRDARLSRWRKTYDYPGLKRAHTSGNRRRAACSISAAVCVPCAVKVL